MWWRWIYVVAVDICGGGGCVYGSGWTWCVLLGVAGAVSGLAWECYMYVCNHGVELSKHRWSRILNS